MYRKIILRLVVFAIFLIGSVGGLIFLSKNEPFPKIGTATSSATASPPPDGQSSTVKLRPNRLAGEPSPTPTPIPIPAQWGKQVRVPILLYHYIGKNPNPADKARDLLSVDPEEFDKQMDYLSQNSFTPISFDALHAAIKGNGDLPAKPVILSFDDGYMDFYFNAYLILKKYGFHSTVFIPTGLMDKSYYLTWAQIKEMDSSGLVSFQAHSNNHINLASLSHDKLIYQLTESKNTLQSQLGKPVNFMAYPYGISDQIVWEATKKAGYLGSVGTWYGTTQSEGTIFDMPRVKIPGGITVENFAKRF